MFDFLHEALAITSVHSALNKGAAAAMNGFKSNALGGGGGGAGGGKISASEQLDADGRRFIPVPVMF